ncbi:hypothetical protein AQF98_05005 [Pedobacter sp. Hv1]|nr:hypothetical protein AQF98_05005 [Pedobacter sp. Hv1]
MLLLIATLFTACKKSDLVQENDFNKSFKTWLNFKSSSNNSYRYQTITVSWGGAKTETIITVKNGKVIGRSYVEKRINRTTNAMVVYAQWEESQENLNSHQEGAKTLTLDEIYEKAKTDWLLKRKDAKSSFEAKNNGMISSCGYVENNCADDCFIGISIDFIEKL